MLDYGPSCAGTRRGPLSPTARAAASRSDRRGHAVPPGARPPIVSAKLLNNFAFLIISLTMLGFALSGVVLTRWLEPSWPAGGRALGLRRPLRADRPRRLRGLIPRRRRPAVPNLTWSGMAGYLLRWVPLALLFAAPFAFCGLILGALLSSPRLPAAASTSSTSWVPRWGPSRWSPPSADGAVERSLMAACLGCWPGPSSWRRPGRADRESCPRRRAWPSRWPRSRRTRSSRCGTTPGLDARGRPRGGANRAHGLGPGGAHRGHADTRRNPPDDVPFLVGSDRAFLERLPADVEPRTTTPSPSHVDYDGRPESLAGIEQTIYAAAYHGRAPEPAPVIGVGGGFDVLPPTRVTAPRGSRGSRSTPPRSTSLTRTYEEYFRAGCPIPASSSRGRRGGISWPAPPTPMT